MACDEPHIFSMGGENMKIHEVTGVTFLTALLIATASIAQEKKINRSTLPAAAAENDAGRSEGQR
jgi:hypothetical protein